MDDFGTPQQTSQYSPALLGSYGFFTPPGDQNYTLMFQTWISFDDAGRHLLSRVKPVREQFDIGSLDLEELVQRDINDSRVSTELIPYLLNREGRQQVFRMFPPIIAVLCPVDERRTIKASYQPKTDTFSSGQDIGFVGGGIAPLQEYRSIYSGDLGYGEYCAVWPVRRSGSGELQSESLYAGKLFINDQKTELVIVDGQHRAMSLIALYRNLTSWEPSGRGKKYRTFYEDIWPNLDFSNESLSGVSLPITICLYPGLSEGEPIVDNISFSQALRSMFITLNSPAVPISRERKLLLTESDLISTCMRELARSLKRYATEHQPAISFENYNIEIDKTTDQSIISDKVCTTGVASLHKICELLLLTEHKEYDSHLEQRGNYGKRTLLDGPSKFSERLDFDNLFTTEDRPVTRNNFNKQHAEVIARQFASTYGYFVSKIFLEFIPFEFHHKACREIYLALAAEETTKSLVFGGQGQQDVISQFEKALDDHRQTFPAPFPHARFDDCKNTISNQHEQIGLQHQKISFRRAKSLLIKAGFSESQISSFGEASTISLLGFLWDQKFRSVAFQCALVLTPALLIELINPQDQQVGGARFLLREPTIPNSSTATNADTGNPNPRFELCVGVSTDAFVDDFLLAVNKVFSPDTKGGLKKLISLFRGDIEDSEAFTLDRLSSWSFSRDGQGRRFSSVICSSMKPNHWCAYRYLFLEIYMANSQLICHQRGADPRNPLYVEAFRQRKLLRERLLNQVFNSQLRSIQDEPAAFFPPEVTTSPSMQQVRDRALELAVERINTIVGYCGVSATDRIRSNEAREALALGSRTSAHSPEQLEELTTRADDDDDANGEDEQIE